MGWSLNPAWNLGVRLVLGLGGGLVALSAFLGRDAQVGSLQPWGALASALALLVMLLLSVKSGAFPPASAAWKVLTGLEILACVGLAWCSGGATSPAMFLLLLLSATSGLQREPWSGLAAGSLAAVLWVFVGVLGPAPVQEPALLLATVLAMPLFGGLGLLVAALQGGTLAEVLGESSRRLEQAHAATRQQAQERERREQELYENQRKLAGLVHLSQQLSSIRQPDQLLAMVARIAKEEMNSALSMVLLVHGQELRVVCSHGVSQLSVEAFRPRVGAGPLGGIMMSGKSLRFSEADGEAWRQALEDIRERLRTLLAVPIQSPHEKLPMGVLVVGNLLVGSRYESEHEDFLSLLATDAAIAIRNLSLYAEVERSYFEIIQALAQAIEAKDPYTSGHVARVRTYATRLAKALGLPPEEVELISKAAILHDVGKISIPDKVLMKPGTLTEEEFEVMKSHVENALHILKDIRSLPPQVFEMVLHHHERYDGGGYPHGLKGEEIPLGAQIIGLADTFDAMTSDRPYRRGFSAEEALNRMEDAMGTQFNPRLLKAFFGLFEFRTGKPLTLNVRRDNKEER